MKKSNPIEVAEYATACGINNEPARIWWVPYTLRRRDQTIASINSRVKAMTHKYGVELPQTIEEALKFDKFNGNTYWRDAIDKEMGNLKVAVDILPEGSKPPLGYTLASDHIVCDVQMTLEWRVCWVKDGQKHQLQSGLPLLELSPEKVFKLPLPMLLLLDC